MTIKNGNSIWLVIFYLAGSIRSAGFLDQTNFLSGDDLIEVDMNRMNRHHRPVGLLLPHVVPHSSIGAPNIK